MESRPYNKTKYQFNITLNMYAPTSIGMARRTASKPWIPRKFIALLN